LSASPPRRVLPGSRNGEEDHRLWGRWTSLQTLTKGGQAQILLVKDKRGVYLEPCVLKRLLNPARLQPNEELPPTVRSSVRANSLKAKATDGADGADGRSGVRSLGAERWRASASLATVRGSDGRTLLSPWVD
jgi:hypothetical protein